jgi:leader peptidase (prepilin peptidase) / N-methyltransferase
MIFIAALIAGIVGFLIGGLLNVLADDLPDRDTVSPPHYPDGTPRPLSAWLGTVAFLTGQRSPTGDNTDDNRLSWRYPITEIATGILFFIAVLRIYAINQSDDIGPQSINVMQALFWLFYLAVFVLVVVIDVEHRLILFAVIIPASLVALIDATLTPASVTAGQWWLTPTEPTLRQALIGAALGFGTFFLFYQGGYLYQRASAELRGWAPEEIPFGYGDVMLITLCGLILGWRPLIFAMFITVFLGAAGAILYLVGQKLRRRQGSLMAALPYGPYIVAGALIMLLFANWMQYFIFRIVYG